MSDEGRVVSRSGHFSIVNNIFTPRGYTGDASDGQNTCY